MPSVYARPPPFLARSATYATPASSTSRNVSSSSSSQPAGSDTDGGSTTDTFATSSSRLADASAASVTSDRTTDSEASGVEGGNDLSQLVYTSSATDRYFPRSELNSILVGSRKRNASADITGLLLYRDGSFAQFLEGPSEAVEATFERIEKDSRHRGVIVVLNRSVKRRDFPDWRMGYRDLDFDLKEENANEDEGQVGGMQVDQLASGLFDLSHASCKDLTHEQMSTSIRTLIRVFHQSLSRPI